ncbi:hypothetical protein Tco_0582054 [Tanacetum coccineum]
MAEAESELTLPEKDVDYFDADFYYSLVDQKKRIEAAKKKVESHPLYGYYANDSNPIAHSDLNDDKLQKTFKEAVDHYLALEAELKIFKEKKGDGARELLENKCVEVANELGLKALMVVLAEAFSNDTLELEGFALTYRGTYEFFLDVFDSNKLHADYSEYKMNNVLGGGRVGYGVLRTMKLGTSAATERGISTSEEYVHSSPNIVYSKGPSNSLLNWYEDLSDEYKDHPTNAKPTFLDISKAKALILAKVQPSGSKAKALRSYSSKAKVQPSRSRAKASRSSYSKAKVQPSGSKAMFVILLEYLLHLQQAFAVAVFALLCNKRLLYCKLLQQAFAFLQFIAFVLLYKKLLQQAFALLQATATSICSNYLNIFLAFALHLQQAFALLQAIAAFPLLCSKHLLCCKLLQKAFAARSYINKHYLERSYITEKDHT